MNYTRQYALLGMGFGCAFPIIATFVQAGTLAGEVSLDAMVEVQSNSLLLWIIDSAPIFLGLLAAFAGRKQDALAATLTDLEKSNLRLDTVNSMLRATNESLTEHREQLEQKISDRTVELSASNDQLQKEVVERKKATEAAQTANRTKGEFLANMSHEVRTPMNAIIGLSELCLRTPLEPKPREYLTRIRRSAAELLGILNDILDFSKIEAGKIILEEVDFDLRDHLERLSDLVGGMASEKGVEFLVAIDKDVPVSLKGDPLRLRQVLVNLSNNAVKFTEKGQIVIRVQPLVIEDERARLRFVIEDTGIGIAAAALPTLFDSFTQADGSTTRKYGGSGLGLTICKNLVGLMGGEVRVESELDVGTTFFVELEFKRHHKEVSSRSPIPVALRNLRVLVVDDNQIAREVMADMLESLKIKPVVAASGKEGIDMLAEAAATEHPFDLMLVDWKMPGLDGFEVVEHIAGDARLADRIPDIVMVTAHGREEAASRAEEAGMSGLLLKPVNQSMLVNTLMEVIGAEGAQTSIRALGPDERELEATRKIRGASVLLVEDNKINQIVAREILENAGMRVEVRDNGKEAVDTLASRRFDAVLMDLQMPVMDGYAATEAIRNDLKLLDLPIIAMTAHAMRGDRERCLEAGMNDHVAKPVDIVALLTTLAMWVKGTSSSVAPPLVAPPTGDLPTQLAGIDIDDALARLGGNKKLLGQLLVEFARRCTSTLAEISGAIDEEAYKEAGRLVHGLKGVAGNVSALRVYETTVAIEGALGRSDTKRLSSLVGELSAAVDEVVGSCSALGAATEVEEDSQDSQDSEDLGAALRRIEPQLEDLVGKLSDFSMDAPTLFSQIKESLRNTGIAAELEALENQIDGLDYEGAIETLDKIRSSNNGADSGATS